MPNVPLRISVHFAALAVWCCAGPETFGAAPAETPVRDLNLFLRRLRTLDHLPELESSRTVMSSTWDRSGGNLDGWDFKGVENGTNVLLDVNARLQILLDHAKRPAIDLPVERFFDDRHGPFPYPLVFHKTYPVQQALGPRGPYRFRFQAAWPFRSDQATP